MKTHRRFVACLTGLTMTALVMAPAAAQSVALVAAQSEIVFTTRQLGVPVQGRFERFSASVTLDPKKPESGQVQLAVDTTSARFGTAELDAEVGKPAWLASAKFPQATFRSTTIKAAAGSGHFDVTGQLTIKGRAHDLVVPVALAPAGGGLNAASGSFTIRRLAFMVGEGEWADTSLLANDVVVRFKLVFSGLPPS